MSKHYGVCKKCQAYMTGDTEEEVLEMFSHHVDTEHSAKERKAGIEMETDREV